MLKISPVYLDQQKSFIPEKNMSWAKIGQFTISKQPALFIDPIFSEDFCENLLVPKVYDWR